MLGSRLFAQLFAGSNIRRPDKVVVVSELLRAAVNDERRGFPKRNFCAQVKRKTQRIVADANVCRGSRYRNGQDSVVEHVEPAFSESNKQKYARMLQKRTKQAVPSRERQYE